MKKEIKITINKQRWKVIWLDSVLSTNAYLKTVALKQIKSQQKQTQKEFR